MRPDHIRAGLPLIFVNLTGEQNLQNGAIWFDIKEAVHKHISGADDNDPVSLLIKQSQIGAILFMITIFSELMNFNFSLFQGLFMQ